MSASGSSTAATTSKPLSRSSRASPSRSSARSSAITTRTAAPPRRRRPAGRAVDRQGAVERLDPRREPGQAGAGGIGAAAAVVDDLDDAGGRALVHARRSTRWRPRACRRWRAPRPRRSTPRSRPRRRARRDVTSTVDAAPGCGRRARRAPAPSPRSARTGGRMPRARSRSSVSARAWPPRAPRRRAPRAPRGRAANAARPCRGPCASATRRACAPSCRSRSIRCSSAAATSTAPARVAVRRSTRAASRRGEQPAGDVRLREREAALEEHRHRDSATPIAAAPRVSCQVSRSCRGTGRRRASPTTTWAA